jgi:hypothetical protein
VLSIKINALQVNVLTLEINFSKTAKTRVPARNVSLWCLPSHHFSICWIQKVEKLTSKLMKIDHFGDIAEVHFDAH